MVNTGKASTYAAAVAELKAGGKCPKETLHRQVMYLNNMIESDHGKLKQLIRPVRGLSRNFSTTPVHLVPAKRHEKRAIVMPISA